MADSKDKGHTAHVLGFTEPKDCLGNAYGESRP